MNQDLSRKIIHIDMDCFYAAIEERDSPKLKGRPLAVGGSPEKRGVIATANYEARKFGVRSAMAAHQAVRLCPDLILIKPRFQKYKETSQEIHQIFQEYTSQIEPLSLDEAFLDVSDCKSATKLAQEIRQRIFKETQLTASAGIAPNKFLSKVASEWRKPDGQFTIAPQNIEAFMKVLPIKNIPGVGKVTAKKMHQLEIQTCGDLQKHSEAELYRLFGKSGGWLYHISRGQDHRPVKTSRQRKSLSVERTFAQDLQNLDEVLSQVADLYRDFENRWNKIKSDYLIKGLFVKIKLNDFTQMTLEKKEFTIPGPSAFSILLEEAFLKKEQPIRLLGVGARLKPKQSTSSSGPQISFF